MMARAALATTVLLSSEPPPWVSTSPKSKPAFSAAPADRDHWGVTVFAAAPGFDRQATVAPYVEAEDGDTLVDLTRIGDDAERKARFKLDAPARLRIVALGEGVGDEMVDYGWVADARGKAVWEMTYRMTDPGGGASKNRQYEGTLELAAGESRG